jgi:hypothetical protein
VPSGGGGDHAVNQALWGDAGLPAPAVDAYGTLEIGGWVELVEVEPQQQAARPGCSARHSNWVAR